MGFAYTYPQKINKCVMYPFLLNWTLYMSIRFWWLLQMKNSKGTHQTFTIRWEWRCLQEGTLLLRLVPGHHELFGFLGPHVEASKKWTHGKALWLFEVGKGCHLHIQMSPSESHLHKSDLVWKSGTIIDYPILSSPNHRMAMACWIFGTRNTATLSTAPSMSPSLAAR